jgi:hypothetical protein
MILLTALFFSKTLLAQDDIEISGFFDVVSEYSAVAFKNGNYALGQAEIDLTRKLGERMEAAVAVCYDNENGNFGIGAATLDLHLFGSQEGHLKRLGNIERSGIIAGQFDIPFGLEWHDYCSIGRKLISSPSAVDATHHGWNDLGIQIYSTWRHINFSLYAVNGFESQAESTWLEFNLSTGQYEKVVEVINTTPENAYGGRVGVTPVAPFELGFSYAVGINRSDRQEMLLWGADFALEVARFHARVEFISHSKNCSFSPETNKGYYLQGWYSLGLPFIALRFGGISLDRDNLWYEHISFGAGCALGKQAEARAEYRINDRGIADVLSLQLAAGF